MEDLRKLRIRVFAEKHLAKIEDWPRRGAPGRHSERPLQSQWVSLADLHKAYLRATGEDLGKTTFGRLFEAATGAKPIQRARGKVYPYVPISEIFDNCLAFDTRTG